MCKKLAANVANWPYLVSNVSLEVTRHVLGFVTDYGGGMMHGLRVPW